MNNGFCKRIILNARKSGGKVFNGAIVMRYFFSNSIRSALPVLLCLMLCCFSHCVIGQEADAESSKAKDKKIKELELRLERLEKIVLATSKLTVLEAERQLERALQEFEHSERLFIKGFITDNQLAQDRFQLQLAEQEVLLAKNAKNARKIAMEIDLMRAKNGLRVAKENLERSERRANRGFSSITEIEVHRKQITIAQKRLEVAQMRFDAISKPIKPVKPKAEKQPESKKKAD